MVTQHPGSRCVRRFSAGGVKLFGFAFVDIISWGVVSVDHAEANITLTSREPTLVKVGEPYAGSIAGKGLIGDLVAVELGGGCCYDFTFHCYGVNPTVEVRSGSGEYLSVFRTLVDYETPPYQRVLLCFQRKTVSTTSMFSALKVKESMF